MQVSEMTKVIMLIIRAYPNSYKNLQKEELSEMVKLWHELIKCEDIDIVFKAVLNFISHDTSGFPPTIGKINEIISENINPQLTESEAWELVERATDEITDWDSSRGKKAWESLPPLIKRALPYRTFLAWGSQSIDQTSYLQTKFNKSYQEVLKHKDELLQLESNSKSKELGNSVFKQLDG